MEMMKRIDPVEVVEGYKSRGLTPCRNASGKGRLGRPDSVCCPMVLLTLNGHHTDDLGDLDAYDAGSKGFNRDYIGGFITAWDLGGMQAEVRSERASGREDALALMIAVKAAGLPILELEPEDDEDEEDAAAEDDDLDEDDEDVEDDVDLDDDGGSDDSDD